MRKGFDFIGTCVSFYCHDGQGNYVLHKRSDNCRDEQGCWDCGGGGIKFGESIEDAVRREVQEEYGTEVLEMEPVGHSDVFRTIDGESSHWIAFRFKVLVNRAKVVNNEPDKHSDLGWFTLDNLPAPLHSQIPHELELYKGKL